MAINFLAGAQLSSVPVTIKMKELTISKLRFKLKSSQRIDGSGSDETIEVFHPSSNVKLYASSNSNSSVVKKRTNLGRFMTSDSNDTADFFGDGLFGGRDYKLTNMSGPFDMTRFQ